MQKPKSYTFQVREQVYYEYINSLCDSFCKTFVAFFWTFVWQNDDLQQTKAFQKVFRVEEIKTKMFNQNYSNRNGEEPEGKTALCTTLFTLTFTNLATFPQTSCISPRHLLFIFCHLLTKHFIYFYVFLCKTKRIKCKSSLVSSVKFSKRDSRVYTEQGIM